MVFYSNTVSTPVVDQPEPIFRASTNPLDRREWVYNLLWSELCPLVISVLKL